MAGTRCVMTVTRIGMVAGRVCLFKGGAHSTAGCPECEMSESMMTSTLLA